MLSDIGSAYISPRTRSIATPSVCSFASPRSVRRNPMASPRRPKPSNATMLDCRSCRMPRPSSRCCRRGSRIYNEVHSHSGLTFLSPKEFLRLSCLAQSSCLFGQTGCTPPTQSSIGRGSGRQPGSGRACRSNGRNGSPWPH
jgi:hypothetical protein